jgi:hypothetical protein
MARRRDDLDQLFTVPPAEFVRARNALAARLQEAGRAAEARDVKRFRKPNATVWTINQLARRDPQPLSQFVETVERLKRAQQTGDAVGQAMTEHRAALNDAIARATDVMEKAGLSRSPDALERVSRTLVGAASDRQASGDLVRGRLTHEHEPPGFDVLTGARPKARSSQPRREKRDRAAQASRAEAARRLRGLERLAVQRQRAADRAAKTADDLRRRLHALERDVADKRAAADAASEAARRARDQR